MLKDAVLDKLNDQLNDELSSAYLYFAMAAYFESVSLKGFANWMEVQAQEELTHVKRIYDYINDRGGRVKLAPVGGPQQDWKSPLAAVTDAYEHECFVSGRIDECVSLTLKEGDHFTNTFLQWFVSEQIEEEATADELVQKLKMIDSNPSGLYLLDNELAGRSFSSDPGKSD